jgi:small-conductance mechanosensitive channel
MQELLDLVGTTPTSLQLMIAFGIAMALATLLVMVLYPILRAFARKTQSFTLEAFSKRTRTAVFWLLAMLLTYSFWNVINASVPEGGDSFFLPGILHLPRTLLYIFGGAFLIQVTRVAGDTIRYRYNVDDVNNLRERKILTQVQYIQRIISIIIFVVVVAFIFLQFEGMAKLGTGILSTAGVGGIIIGLAAQKSIANLLAGFQIAFTQPIRLDDVLIVNGEFGTVEEITLTYVTMKLWDERRQVIPLQYFIDNVFQNWTRNTANLIGSVFLHLDYTFPVDKLRAEVERYLPTQEFWDERVGTVAVTDTTDRVIVVRILVSSNNAGNTFTLRCNTREHLLAWVRKNHPDKLPTTRSDKGIILMPGVVEESNEG